VNHTSESHCEMFGPLTKWLVTHGRNKSVSCRRRNEVVDFERLLLIVLCPTFHGKANHSYQLRIAGCEYRSQLSVVSGNLVVVSHREFPVKT